MTTAYYLFLTFTVFLYIRPVDFFPFLAPLHLTRLTAVIAFTALLLNQGKSYKNIRNIFIPSPQTKFMNILFGLLILSISTSVWKSNSLTTIIAFSKIYIIFLLIINVINTLKRFRTTIFLMILCGTTISFLAIKGFYTGEVRILHNRLYASFNSLISDPNDFAQIILMILPFAIYGLLNKRISILNKFILFSSIIAFLYVLILTGSRGGLLGLCAVTFFIWIKSRKKFRLFIIFLICAAIFWNFAPSQYKQRINSIKTASSEDASAVSRINAWKAGWKMMTHNILGVGAGNFSQGFYKYKPSDVYTPVGKRIPAHNMFIQIGSETGFGGLISFLALFFYSFKSLSALNKIKSNSNELEEIKLFANATYVSLGGYGVTGIFLSQAYSWFLYYLFAFSVALHYISQHILDKKEKT